MARRATLTTTTTTKEGPSSAAVSKRPWGVKIPDKLILDSSLRYSNPTTTPLGKPINITACWFQTLVVSVQSRHALTITPHHQLNSNYFAA